MDLIYMQMKGNKRRIHTGNPGMFEKRRELDLAQVTHPRTHRYIICRNDDCD